MRQKNSVIGSFVATFFILVARSPDRVFVPGFWAEDGAVFFRDALRFPFWENLVRPNLGYLQVLQRGVAGITAATQFFEAAPFFWNLLSFIIAAGMLCVFASQLYAVIVPNKTIRFLLPLIIAASGPHFEILGNLTNIHSYLALLGVHLVVYLSSFPRHQLSWKLSAVVAGFLLLGVLSSPYCFVALPFVLLAWWEHRPSRRIGQYILVGSYILGCIIQGVSFAAYQRQFSSQTTQFDASILATEASPTFTKAPPQKIISVWAKRVIIQNYVPSSLAETMLGKGLIKYLGVMAGGAIVYLWWYSPRRREISILIVFTIVNVIVLYVGRPIVLNDIAHTGFQSYFAGRYFFVTTASCWLITAIVLAHRKQFSSLLCCIVFAQLAAGLLFFQSQITLHDYQWQQYAKKITSQDDQQTLKIPINPPGWFIELP